MRVLVQRALRGEVRVGQRVVGRIGRGLVLLVGFTHTDGDEQVRWMAEKIVGLRIFRRRRGQDESLGRRRRRKSCWSSRSSRSMATR